MGWKDKGTAGSSSSKSIKTHYLTSIGAVMNKEEIQERIRYSSISYAREHGIISKEEADFILDEYVNVKECRDAHPRAEK